jgi:hypothetical protein
MATKKLKLDFEKSNSGEILGIVTFLPDYMMALQINSALNINFKRYDDFIYEVKGRKHFYSWFFAYYEDFKTKLYLVSNRSTYTLIPKFKNIDYLLFFDSNPEKELLDILQREIRKLPKVSGIFSLNLNKIGNIDLLFEKNELHELNVIKSS